MTKGKLCRLDNKLETILTVSPITNKRINRGYRAEILVKLEKTGVLDYSLDCKANTIGGDVDKGNYSYQVKANRCELKITKEVQQIEGIEGRRFTKEQIIDIYTKHCKANRYIYFIEVDNVAYTITMNKQQFTEFVAKFMKYSHSENCLRMNIKDTTIYNWIMEK